MTLAAAQFDLITPGNQAAWNNGPIKLYRLGWFWFDYGDYHGELHYIRFAHQIFFAPDTKVTGYGFQLAPGVRGVFHTVYTKLPDDPFTVAGNVISAYTGKVPGLAAALVGGGVGTAPTLKKIGQGTRLLKGRVSFP